LTKKYRISAVYRVLVSFEVSKTRRDLVNQTTHQPYKLELYLTEKP